MSILMSFHNDQPSSVEKMGTPFCFKVYFLSDIFGLFAAKRLQARERYRSFVQKGIPQGRRKDLTGGGLLRSAGGWLNVKALREAKIFYKSDERILGDSDFVDSVLAVADEKMERKYALQAAGLDLDVLAEIVAGITSVKPSRIFSPGKNRSRVRARSLLCFWATRELGITLAELSRRTRISQSSISMSVHRGEQIVEREGYSLSNELKLKNRRALTGQKDVPLTIQALTLVLHPIPEAIRRASHQPNITARTTICS